MEDVLSLARVLEWGGISFGKNQWFKIRLAVKVEFEYLSRNYLLKQMPLMLDFGERFMERMPITI